MFELLSNNITVVFIGIIAIALLIILFKRYSKQAVLLIVQTIVFGAAGLAAVYFINHFSPLEHAIGINIFNGLFIGILGLPGLVTLYVAAAVL